MTFLDPWIGIPTPDNDGDLRARSRGLFWYAVDSMGCPHILIPISKETPPSHLFTTRGVTAEIAALDPKGGPRGKWIDITCNDPTNRDAFKLLSLDLNDAIPNLKSSPQDAVINILERWRWFWSSKPDPKPLSGREALGLFAELWFLRHWINEPASVCWWRGPLDDRHDFVHPDLSIEVKATKVRGDSETTHIISNIDQLDNPSTGSLMVFSLTVSPDTLAKYSLTSLVDDIDSWMLDTAYSQMWRERLHQAGWSPIHANRYRDNYRIIQQCLYQVDDDFPRIVRSSFVGGNLPTGVTELTYSINPTYAVKTHLLASEPNRAQELLSPMRDPALYESK